MSIHSMGNAYKKMTPFVRRQWEISATRTHVNVTAQTTAWRPTKSDIGPRQQVTYRATRRNMARVSRNRRVSR